MPRRRESKGKSAIEAGGASGARAAQAIRRRLAGLANRERAAVLGRFFKTGPGQYGEGDRFLGIKVPDLRAVAGEHADASHSCIADLLRSRVHEERLVALLMLVSKYSRGDESERERVFRFYLESARYVNNWDLVDLTAGKIVGEHLAERDKSVLDELARSGDLWERRIAIIATSAFIRRGSYSHTLRIADALLMDEHDLIHKAVGWMLREVGKRDRSVEEKFLKRRYKRMPRTMLRYAIERFPERRRRQYLKGTV
jgi:3-methyladenine DNA glycosylase AlkD